MHYQEALQPADTASIAIGLTNNSVALIRKRTIPTERPPRADRGVSLSQRGGSLRP
jgi:hypothetical protein